jgi:hypothetical protein
MPYATKVLAQEMAGIMNIGLRFITTGDTQMLRPFKPLDPNVRVVKVLEDLQLPEIIQQEQIPQLEDVTQQIPLDALQAMGDEAARAAAEAASAKAEDQPIIDEDAPIEVTGDQNVIVVQQGIDVPGLEGADENESVVLVQQEPQQVVAPAPPLLRRDNKSAPANVVIQPPPTIIQEVPAGAPAKLFPSPIPGAPPTIVVQNPKPAVINIDTSPTAMAAEGLAAPVIQPNATLRRANVGNFTVSRLGSEDVAPPSGANVPIVVRKLG